MSNPASESESVVTGAAVPGQAGLLLKAAREAQGLHIGALAVALKVPVKKLEALEAGRFEELPDMVFARSLTLSVCRALKIDPTPIMASLPERQFDQFKSSETALNTSFKDSAGPSHHVWLAQMPKPLAWAVLALVVAIVAILAWPASPLYENQAGSAANPAEQVLPAVPSDAQPAPPQEQPASGASSAAPAGPVAASSMPQPVAAGAAAPVIPATPAVVAVATPDASTAPAVLELSGHGESWVEVTDASGQTKVRKLILSGEIIRVAGVLPLQVTVGRADKVTASVRGQALDLTPLARENVARFEVK